MKDESCSNSVDWQTSPYHVYVFPLNNRNSNGILYVDDYSTYAYRNDKNYILYRFIFDPVQRSVTCEQIHKNAHNTSLICPRIAGIVIVKNQTMSWSRYNSVTVDGKCVEGSEVTHFKDRIEITNLNLDISLNCVLMFAG